MSKPDENGGIEIRFKVPSTTFEYISNGADEENRSSQMEARELMYLGIAMKEFIKNHRHIFKSIRQNGKFHWNL